jgi:hypothetical protein
MDHEVPREQQAAIIEDTFVICRQEDRYIGWPTVCARRNGEIVAVFSGDRDAHVCPWGKVQLVRSTDGGNAWSAPETVCNTLLDDRDAGIIELRDGALVIAWFTSLAFEDTAKGALKRGPSETMTQWLRHAEKLTPQVRAEGLGHFTRRSEDGGKTWDDPVRTLGSAPHGPIELADGRLLYVGRRNPHRGTELTVEESRDGGHSWQQISSIEAGPGDDINRFHEPHVAECADGRLVALFRYHFHDPETGRFDGARSFLRQSTSEDGGKTWTPTAVTGMLGYPPHLIRLRDGTLVCVYGRRLPPYGEYACISRDGGRTWDTDREIKLAGAPNGDLGYPASAELPDGTILTVYYQIYRPGEKTCLMGTRWRLRESSLGQQE